MIQTECKYCNSLNTVKYGTFEGTQYYWCKDCQRKFADNKALPKQIRGK
jgi:transposase-like protein